MAGPVCTWFPQFYNDFFDKPFLQVFRALSRCHFGSHLIKQHRLSIPEQISAFKARLRYCNMQMKVRNLNVIWQKVLSRREHLVLIVTQISHG